MAMPNGLYSVPLLVKDLQGFGKEQTVNVRVCTCEREDSGLGICGLGVPLPLWAVWESLP